MPQDPLAGVRSVFRVLYTTIPMSLSLKYNNLIQRMKQGYISILINQQKHS